MQKGRQKKEIWRNQIVAARRGERNKESVYLRSFWRMVRKYRKRTTPSTKFLQSDCSLDLRFSRR
jgi:hypothetical protein